MSLEEGRESDGNGFAPKRLSRSPGAHLECRLLVLHTTIRAERGDGVCDNRKTNPCWSSLPRGWLLLKPIISGQVYVGGISDMAGFPEQAL